MSANDYVTMNISLGAPPGTMMGATSSFSMAWVGP
jgi:hypothetical protein